MELKVNVSLFQQFLQSFHEVSGVESVLKDATFFADDDIIGDLGEAQLVHHRGFEHLSITDDGSGDGVTLQCALAFLLTGIGTDADKVELTAVLTCDAAQLALLFEALITPTGPCVDDGEGTAEIGIGNRAPIDVEAGKSGNFLVFPRGFVLGKVGLEPRKGCAIFLFALDEREQLFGLFVVGLVGEDEISAQEVEADG